MSRLVIKVKPQAGDLKPALFPPRHRAKRQGRGRGRAAQARPALIAMVSRDLGSTVLRVGPDVSRRSLEPVLRQTIAPGAMLYTDSAKWYQILDDLGYGHDAGTHSIGDYVRRDLHENRAETVWSRFQPWLARFRGVSQDNLPTYATLFQVLRNYRALSAWQRAIFVLSHDLEDYAADFLQAASWLRDHTLFQYERI
ncbi:MAG: IS1595 family transposase [Ardenticatenaceae bacterium]|nr:IS1595 family transposase [Ardenticatenaceae bacterium]